MSDKTLIRNIFSNANFSDQEMDFVLGSFTKVTFKKNDLLINEGQVLDHYYEVR